MHKASFFHPLNPQNSSIPSEFTFPFHYKPHALVLEAAEKIEHFLKADSYYNHDFWNNDGKMFGVLIVENKQKQLGFLAAYSGMIGGKNDGPFFVPSIYHRWEKDGFFKQGEKLLNEWNNEVKVLELERKEIQQQVDEGLKKLELDLQDFKQNQKEKKLLRKKRRVESPDDDRLHYLLDRESHREHFRLKDFKVELEDKKSKILEPLRQLDKQIQELKDKRRATSADLQKRLFESYIVHNANNESTSVYDLFPDMPPAGTGDCCAPKLLNYAYQNELKPIAIGEFWWGKSPKLEIRKHKHYYPACKSKCEPLLGFMLQGLQVEKNPLKNLIEAEKDIEIIHEDDHLIVVNKPAHLLSVKGKHTKDCVELRIRKLYPDLEGPVIVHRLDFSTSGILLLTKTKEAYVKLQEQFIKRKVHKKYRALLEGVPTNNEGEIILPLRVDLDNRPQQMVCYEHGLNAHTKYRVLDKNEMRALVEFIPITGRTHQLRMHASHVDGLNCPIVGDELYGTAHKRLHLQALEIDFEHPITRKKMKYKLEPEFELFLD